jgi:hypothetical protein
MANAVPRECQTCGTSLSVRDGRCPNPNCAGDVLTLDAQDMGTTRVVQPAEGASPAKTVAVGIGAILLIVALGYGLVQLGIAYFDTGRPEPTIPPKPAAPVAVATADGAAPGVLSASPSPSPVAIQPSPSPGPSGPRQRVANTENLGVRLRQSPSTGAPVLRSLAEGAVVEVVGPDTQADGITWRNVREPGGAVGWVSAEFLVPD